MKNAILLLFFAVILGQGGQVQASRIAHQRAATPLFPSIPKIFKAPLMPSIQSGSVFLQSWLDLFYTLLSRLSGTSVKPFDLTAEKPSPLGDLTGNPLKVDQNPKSREKEVTVWVSDEYGDLQKVTVKTQKADDGRIVVIDHDGTNINIIELYAALTEALAKNPNASQIFEVKPTSAHSNHKMAILDLHQPPKGEASAKTPPKNNGEEDDADDNDDDDDDDDDDGDSDTTTAAAAEKVTPISVRARPLLSGIQLRKTPEKNPWCSDLSSTFHASPDSSPDSPVYLCDPHHLMQRHEKIHPHMKHSSVCQPLHADMQNQFGSGMKLVVVMPALSTLQKIGKENLTVEHVRSVCQFVCDLPRALMDLVLEHPFQFLQTFFVLDDGTILLNPWPILSDDPSRTMVETDPTNYGFLPPESIHGHPPGTPPHPGTASYVFASLLAFVLAPEDQLIQGNGNVFSLLQSIVDPDPKTRFRMCSDLSHSRFNGFRSTMLNCWKHNPDDRPDPVEVLLVLNPQAKVLYWVLSEKRAARGPRIPPELLEWLWDNFGFLEQQITKK
jgi:hypothetical protein